MKFLLAVFLIGTISSEVHCKALDEVELYREKKFLDVLEKLFYPESKSSQNLQAGHSSAQDTEVHVPDDVSNPTARSTISECMLIMDAYKKSPETTMKKSNKAVKSCWPYSRSLNCMAEHSRDLEYDPNKSYETKSLPIETCGKTMYMNTKDTEETNDNDVISILKRILEPENEPTQKKIEQRIVGGSQSRAGKYPWMATIGKAQHGLSCGGSIIGKRWILSAAHCFSDRDYPCLYNVRVGSLNWGYDTEGYHEDIAAEKILRHPNYDEDTNDNDIALIKLSKDLELDESGYINAVCLPESDPEDKNYQEGKSCIAAGWGTLKEDGPVPMDLQEVETPLIKRKDCKHEQMTRNQFCAGLLKGGVDTCQGDSGGPVMCQRDDNRWYQQGVTSYGNGCGRKHWPGVYTQVSHYNHWIKSVIARYP